MGKITRKNLEKRLGALPVEGYHPAPYTPLNPGLTDNIGMHYPGLTDTVGKNTPGLINTAGRDPLTNINGNTDRTLANSNPVQESKPVGAPKPVEVSNPVKEAKPNDEPTLEAGTKPSESKVSEILEKNPDAKSKEEEMVADAIKEICKEMAEKLLDTIDSSDDKCSNDISGLLNASIQKMPDINIPSSRLKSSCAAGATSSLLKWSVYKVIPKPELGNTSFTTDCQDNCSTCYATYQSAEIMLRFDRQTPTSTTSSVASTPTTSSVASTPTTSSVASTPTTSSASSLMNIETRFISMAMMLGLLFLFMKRFK